MSDNRRTQRLKVVAAPALLVVLPLCLFGPHTIYHGNVEEFSAPFWTLVRPLLAAGLAVAAMLSAIGVLLPRSLASRWVALLFGLGVVIWAQGNLLVADYAAFTGAAIDWTVESWRNPYELALWTIVPLAAVGAARHVAPIAPFASTVLLGLQTGLLVVSAVQAGPETRREWKGPSEAMFDLSSSRNVLHIVLDGFQSEFFHELLEENRADFDRRWSGAVFFADHAGAFPSTMVSIPAMLTGTVYRNERDVQRYIRDHFEKGSLFKSLRAAGFRVDSITEMQYDNRSATNFFRMPRPYVSYDEYVQFGAWQLADLSLFRHAPHRLRPYIHNDDEWRLQARFGPGDTKSRRLHPVNGAAVLGEFSERLTVATGEPLYKYIHVGIPHMPIAVGADCGFTGVQRATRERYKAQASCAVARVSAILDRLRAQGVYDNTLVVVSSDHGLGFTPRKFAHNRQVPAGAMSTLAARAMALLVVKAPGRTGPVEVSRAPTAITDIPATVLDAMGVRHELPGEPALKLAADASRVRSFAMYNWEHENWSQQYFDVLDIMEIKGPLLDGRSWSPAGSIYAPAVGEDSRVRGLYEIQRSRSGFDYRWSMPRAFFHAPEGARRFQLAVRSLAPTPQTVTVAAGDRELGVTTLKDQAWVTLTYPLPQAGDGGLWVEVRVDPSWKPRGDGRTLGVQTRDLKWMP